MQLSLSVIIPTYNVERFIEKAIHSALEQMEVTEVVVVDDGSTDATIAIITSILATDKRVQLYQHPNGINKGRSATRNLGIQKATGDYIAFLDADDYYLPNRFTNDFKIFEENPNCDGVYNAIGTQFYNAYSKKNNPELELFTVVENISYQELFQHLLKGGKGHFSIDGLTVKKKVFEQVGLFNEKLIVAEDTDLLWKMAIKCRLETGIIDYAVAIRGVHDANVFDNEELYKVYHLKMLQSVLIWASKNKVQAKLLDMILKQIWIIKQKQANRLVLDIKFWTVLFLPHYQLLFSMLSIKYFPVVRYRQTLFPFLYSSIK